MSRALSTTACACIALGVAACSLSLPGSGGPSAIIIYAGTAGGVQDSPTGGSTWTAVGSLPNVSTLVAISSGTFVSVYAGTTTGLYLSTDGATWNQYVNLPGPVNWIQVSGTSIYAATGAGVSVSDTSGTTNVGALWTPTTISGGATRIYFDGTNTFAATSGGLWVSNTTSTTTYTMASNGLPANSVSAVYSDGTNVWVGTTGNGIAELPIATLPTSSPSTIWTTYTNATTAGGLAGGTINGITASGSTIYAATSAGLSVFNGATWTTVLSGIVNSVYVSGTDIYAATSNSTTG